VAKGWVYTVGYPDSQVCAYNAVLTEYFLGNAVFGGYSKIRHAYFESLELRKSICSGFLWETLPLQLAIMSSNFVRPLILGQWSTVNSGSVFIITSCPTQDFAKLGLREETTADEPDAAIDIEGIEKAAGPSS
jgi:hypothetical protein